MSATTLNGNLVAIYLKVSTTYKLVTCNTDATMSKKVDTIDKTTKCSNGNKEIEAGDFSWEVSGTCTMNTTPDTGEVSYDELNAICIAKTKSNFAFKTADDSDVYETGDGFITSLETTSNTGDLVKFSMTITGTGALDVTP